MKLAHILFSVVMAVIDPLTSLFRAAMRATAGVSPALPRLIHFAQHPFQRRGYGRTVAGGGSIRRILALAFSRPVLTAAVIVALVFGTAALGHETAGMLMAGAAGQTVDLQAIKNTLDQQNRLFEEFKNANDERLKQIEKNGTADAALVTKVEQLNASITELQAQIREVENAAARPTLGRDGKPVRPEVKAHAEAFDRFVRKGIDDGLADLEIKAAHSVGTAADGGYALPEEIDRNIASLLQDISPIRSLANVVQVGTSDWKKLFNLHGTSSGWVGETAARPATNTSQLAEVAPPMGEIYANPAATQRSLDDLFFNVEQFMQDEAVEEFAKQEGTAFVNGDGTNKPKGFLTYTTAATSDKAGRAFGTIQHIATGVAGDLGATPYDQLIDMIQALKAGHRRNASWVMNALTLGRLRKVKDTTNNYIWQPAVAAGQPSTLLGYGVTEAEDMPDIAANALVAAFAHWKAAYTVVDRVGIRTLRDPYTNKPYVHFYMTKRVGGSLMDSQAIKLLKVAAA